MSSDPIRPSALADASPELPGAPLDVAIVGAGRVGCSIGRALAARGHRLVAAVVGRPASAARVVEALGSVTVVAPAEAAALATVVVCSVPDDALEDVAPAVARGLRPGAVVVHTSGISGIRPLEPCGPNVAAIHPARSIAEPTTDLDGVFYGVTAPDHMRAWAAWFVRELGGRPVEVAEDARALYHAALSITANFTVALAGDAADLLGDPAVVAALLTQTASNVVRLGADRALTGPIVRGDAGTGRKHLDALALHAPELLEVYVANARRALERAVRSERLDPAAARVLAEVLGEALVR